AAGSCSNRRKRTSLPRLSTCPRLSSWRSAPTSSCTLRPLSRRRFLPGTLDGRDASELRSDGWRASRPPTSSGCTHDTRLRLACYSPGTQDRQGDPRMGTVIGSELLAQALKSQGVDTMFYVMGGPMLETEATCIKLGIRAIDTRHEQAAALAAHAWGR